MGIRKGSLFAYTFAHFCVDFSCFFILFRRFAPGMAELEELAVGFLVYNILAFGLQPVVGFLCDEHPRFPAGILGCGLVGLAVLLPWGWPGLLVCSLGNALFHVAGGVDSLRFAHGKLARGGVFVSSGALGVALGTLAGKSALLPILVPVLLMLLCIVALVRFAGGLPTGPCVFQTASSGPFSLVLVLALVSVVLRSYVGGVIPMEWKHTALLMLLPGVASCAGKAAGGFLADRFGARLTGVAALVISLPLLCFGERNAILCTLGILFFNMTMPVTLGVVASKLPHNPGLAFGLTTLALLCGTVPTFFFVMPKAWVLPVMAVLILASALCVAFSTSNIKAGKQSRNNGA